MARSPENGNGGRNGIPPSGLRPARGEIPRVHADFIKPKSPVENQVEDMREALRQIGKEQPKLTSDEVKKLLPYYQGSLEIPPKTTPNGRDIWKNIALYQDQLRAAHEKAGDTWMRDPQNTVEMDRIRAHSAKRRDVTPLGIPFTPKGSGASDLPEIPPSLALAFHEDQNLGHKARNAFTLALSGIGFKKTPEGKLCEIFTRLFKERNKSHIDAHDIAMKNQFDNAALALLSYKIIYPVVQKQKMGDGSEKERVGFGMNLKLLERHAEVFLTREKWTRLQKMIEKEKNSERKSALQLELESLRESKKDADRFIFESGKSLGLIDADEIFVENDDEIYDGPARTIFESFGNRLYVRASDLPVFDVPQPADTEKGRAIASRSLDAALKILTERASVDETKFRSTDLVIRASEFSNVLQYAGEELQELVNTVAQFKEGIVDEDTRFVARRILKQLVDKVDQDEIRSVRRVRDRAKETMEKSEKSEASTKMRRELFTPLEKKASELLGAYESLLQSLGEFLFTQNATLMTANKSESGARVDTSTSAFAEKIQTLEQRLDDMLTEIGQNRELIQLVQTVIADPRNSRKEIGDIIEQFLAADSAGDTK